MSQETGLYFAQFPKKFNNFLAVLVSTQDEKGANGETLSEFRQSYREIIFTEPEVLIAPKPCEEYESVDQAVIIAENNVLESARFLGTLKRFSLKISEKLPVTRNLFSYCLEFVMSHRLAPLWNKIGPYYVQGKDFLQEEGKMFSIKIDLSLTDKITLALNAQMLKLPPSQVEEFGISPNIMEKFCQFDSFSIEGHSLENNACIALPSLKTGYITRIAHKRTDYMDFKRYWKLMYGFRLPDGSVDIVYSVRFSASSKVFSYPSCCIRSTAPLVSLRCDQKAVFSCFIQDLASRFPSLCGSPLTFTSSTLYPRKTFYVASLSKQTNLTRSVVPSNATKAFVWTGKKASSSDDSNSTLQNTSKNNHDSLMGEILVSKRGTEKPYVPCFTNKKSSIPKSKTAIFDCESQQEVKQSKSVVPRFGKKSASCNSRKENVVKDSACATKSVVILKGKETTVIAATGTRGTVKRNMRAGDSESENHTGSWGVGGHTAQVQEQERNADSRVGGVEADVFKSNSTPTNSDGSKRKRVEKKPKREINSDMMRKLALENKLSKISAVAISSWLKTEGVRHKSKARKPELILKVYEHLQLLQPEP